MIKPLCLLGLGFFAGYYSKSSLSYSINNVPFPYEIVKRDETYYLSSDTFEKQIYSAGELGSVYERMQGLLKEDKLDLDYALKKIQRTKFPSKIEDND